MAKHFLDERGKPHPDIAAYPDGPFAIYNDAAYRQDHVPVTQQATAVGHAVRATYLYSAMTDVAGLSGDTAYGAAVDRLWADVVAKRLYVTGGIGSRGVVEAFGEDYELPNRNAYTETCASIGNALWGHRMFLLRGEGRYVDVLERILYNGYLSGVSLGGTRFFYQNPLESAGESDRTDYFEVACCPSNLARMMAQLPGLIYARRGDDVFVNLFIGSRTRVQAGGASVAIAQTTRYPWDGTVRLAIDPDRPTTMALRVRVPGWSRNEALPSDLYRFAESSREAVALRVNGKGEPVTLDQGYLVLRRRWTAGDTVELRLPMPVRRLLANGGVQEDRGRVALQRGPLMYAVEGIDHAGHALNLVLPPGAPLATSFRAGLLGGVQVITGTARVVDAAGAAPRDVPMLAIPYYAWNNRGRGEMAVWIPTAPR
ncbi:MAG: glycoside hydrolase family 127 protein [Acidobacteria bacterium]|nr:glycoside hydrolase family 127 protein [Acidobacteriota bacterium]